MANDRESLDDLRREIDEIDENLHDLLMRRAGLVERIRAVKRMDSIATVRPGREAFILRKLTGRHSGGFPIGAILRIWREIIAGITRMEKPDYAVAVYGGEGSQAYWDMARDQFGSLSPMTSFNSARDVIRTVGDGKAEIGVVPYPEDGAEDPWWLALTAPDGLRVSYKLPFFPGTNARPTARGPDLAFAVGRVVSDPTENDRTLMVIEAPEPISRSALGELTKKAELDARFIAACRQGDWYALVEIGDYVGDDDPRLAALSAMDEIARTVLIGAYAEPIAAVTDEA
jgi:chorismate mutase/prephenate dehydratase